MGGVLRIHLGQVLLELLAILNLVGVVALVDVLLGGGLGVLHIIHQSLLLLLHLPHHGLLLRLLRVHPLLGAVVQVPPILDVLVVCGPIGP
jgi:hypothetical protein